MVERCYPGTELLPCPLCGEKRISLNKPGLTYEKGSINCPACLLTLPGEVNEAELIKCWNDRFTASAQAVPDAEALDKLIQRHASAYVARGSAISDAIIAECKASREALLAALVVPSTNKTFNPLDAGFSLVDDGRICHEDDPDCRHPLCDCARYVSEQRASSVPSTLCGTPKVVGRVTGKEYEGDQVPGMPGAICHACGLGYKCDDQDCPNKASAHSSSTEEK